MKKYLIILAMALTAIPVFAQKDAKAKAVLDATAAKLTGMKGMKASFSITSFIGTSEQGTSSGTMYISGKKCKMESSDLITWFDGKTQWAYLPQNDEVNISTPTKEEQVAMNPCNFIGLYRSGYNYTMRQTSVLGQSVYEVHLTAEKAGADIAEAYVDVNMSYLPVSIRVRQGKNWTRIRVSSINAQKLGNDTFTFPKAKYPNADVIDLR